MTVTNFSYGRSPATATLDGHPFPFYINSCVWGYQMNTASFDTIGGRVIQILSTRITTMQVEGDAGDRDRLLSLYEYMISIQTKQIQTQMSSVLNIPSRGWTF